VEEEDRAKTTIFSGFFGNFTESRASHELSLALTHRTSSMIDDACIHSQDCVFPVFFGFSHDLRLRRRAVFETLD
jgi:hypothetical protein